MKMKEVFRKNILSAAGIAAAVLAAGMVLTATAGRAWSYFTTYTSATGGYTVTLGSETQIEEEYSDHTKHLTVSNEGSMPVYVRAMVFSGSRYALTCSSEDGSWQAGSDGYYYYSRILDAASVGEDGALITPKTSELLVRIGFPEDAEEGENCNVVIIYESTPVQYGPDGSALAPQEADWTRELITGGVEGGSE